MMRKSATHCTFAKKSLGMKFAIHHVMGNNSAVEINEKNLMRQAHFKAIASANGAQIVAIMPDGNKYPIAWCENRFWAGLNSNGILDGLNVARALSNLLNISKEIQDEIVKTGDLPKEDEPLNIRLV